MSTNTPIASFIEELSIELLYPIFRLVIATKYVTLPGFCNFISQNCLEFDPFTSLCSSVIAKCDIVIAKSGIVLTDNGPYSGISGPISWIEGEIRSDQLSSEFYHSTVFTNFVKVLIKFNMKFQRIQFERPEDSPILSKSWSRTFEFLIKNKFVKFCCKELYCSICSSPGERYHEDFFNSLSQHSDIVKGLEINMDLQECMKHLPKFLNIEVLKLLCRSEEIDNHIEPLKQWVRLVSETNIKRKIQINLLEKISDSFIQFMIETIANHKLIDVKINVLRLSPTPVEALTPLKDHINTAFVAVTDFWEIPIKFLNSSSSLHKISFISYPEEGINIEHLANRNINELKLILVGSRPLPIPVANIIHFENLKSLFLNTNDCDFTKLKHLKNLRVRFAFQLDTKASLLLPSNLETMTISVSGESTPNSEFGIANKEQLKKLRRVSLELDETSNFGLTQKFIYCLPTSLTTFNLTYGKPLKLNFGQLINLETLSIYADMWYNSDEDLEICELPLYLRSLFITTHHRHRLVTPALLPNTLQELFITLDPDYLSRCFMSNLNNDNSFNQLSSLTIEMYSIEYIDLRKIIPNSVIRCRLILGDYRNNFASGNRGPNNFIIELPFESHPNLDYLFVGEPMGGKVEVSFRGELSESNKPKLKLS